MGRPIRVIAGVTLTLGLAFSFAITVLRAWQPEVAATPLLVGFAPLTIPGLATAVVLLLIGLPFGGLRVRPAVALATMGALAVQLMWLLPTYTPQPDYRPGATADTGGPTIRIMSINALLGSADQQATQRLVSRVHPDVLVLSEITGAFETALDEGRITDLPLVAGDGEAMTRVYSSLAPSGDAEPLSGDFGWRVPLELEGQVVQVYGVHPIAPHLTADDWWSDHRVLRQATAATPGPSLIAGDLNATLDHGPVIDLQDAGFSDAARAAGLGWAPTWPANGRPVPVRVLALDHVMARGPWTLADVGRADLQRTDHQTVWATWRLDRPLD